VSDDFLTRWSRRKRDAAETDHAKSAPGERDSVPEDAILESATPVEPATPLEPAFDLKSLPPIESITAATDIRPFLAPGVPVELARAALRRAWSSDPRIRDFVGLADYDWDYHTPGSAAGFGPLEMTDELRRMVARILGDIVDADTPGQAREPATSAECPEESQPLGDGANCAAQPAEIPFDHTRPAAALHVPPAAAVQHETSEEHAPRPSVRRGHGRALPK
jgi:Protein of unknown function (DUF3306)